MPFQYPLQNLANQLSSPKFFSDLVKLQAYKLKMDN